MMLKLCVYIIHMIEYTKWIITNKYSKIIKMDGCTGMSWFYALKERDNARIYHGSINFGMKHLWYA